MTDLRKAAEMALEAWEKPYGERGQAVEDAIEALRQALAQPEQEPVAWMHKEKGKPLEFYMPDEGEDCENCEHCIPLYTAPPKREWQGLTDEELKVLCDEWQIIYGGYVRPFAETIEAKLREKNA